MSFDEPSFKVSFVLRKLEMNASSVSDVMHVEKFLSDVQLPFRDFRRYCSFLFRLPSEVSSLRMMSAGETLVIVT
jgi:hypothetical protein